MKKRAHIFILGKVQGVFFRQKISEKAKSLNLKGWVRNTADGKVEAIFEGEEEKIFEMIEWAKIGPPLAKVENLNLEWQEFKEEFEDFQIRYY